MVKISNKESWYYWPTEYSRCGNVARLLVVAEQVIKCLWQQGVCYSHFSFHDESKSTEINVYILSIDFQSKENCSIAMKISTCKINKALNANLALLGNTDAVVRNGNTTQGVKAFPQK